MTPALPPIHPQSLQTQVSTTTLARGLALYRNLQVLAYEVDDVGDGWLELEGEVQGTAPEPYWVNVSLRVEPDGRVVSFDGSCSCPVGTDCKHCVALTLKVAYQSGSLAAVAKRDAAPAEDALAPAERARLLAQKNVDQWLALFTSNDDAVNAEHAAPALQADAPREDMVVYMLASVNRDKGPVLHMGYGLAYRLKKGGWSKVKSMGYALPTTATAQDRDVMQLFAAMGAQYGGHTTSSVYRPLGGEAGQLVLRLAAQTGRLFSATDWHILERPLTVGPTRLLHWRWDEVRPDARLGALQTPADDVAWELKPLLDDPAAVLYRNTPPLYMDVAAGLCGLVDAPGVSAQDLPLLLKAPPIPQASFAQHEATWLRRLAHVPLPPTMEPPQELHSVAPVAHLSLAPAAPRDVAQLGLLSAALEFDYAGHRVSGRSPHTPLLIDADGQRMLLHRDLEAENAARHRLQQLGLLDDAQGRFHLPPAPQGHPSPWLLWADDDFALLRAAGLELVLDDRLRDWITRADTVAVAMESGAMPGDADLGGANDSGSPWFHLSLGVEVNGERHNILPWLPTLLGQLTLAHAADLPPYVYLPQGSGYLRLPTEPLRPWLQALLDLVAERGHSFNSDSLRLSRLEALRVGAVLGEGARWSGADSLHRLVQQLAGHGNLPEVAPPQGLHASLRPYQQQGLNWLQFLRTHGLSGVLADDMGLGKTLQTLAHILVEKESGRLQQPALIVAPVSLMGNWLRETARFTPGLRAQVLHGQDRHEAAADMATCDIVIAPYSLLQRDRERWLAQHWHLVVLDEAQNIKNASTGAAQVAAELRSNHRLCLSGTPMENHLGELWSLFYFLMPGFLGSQRQFKELFRTPIEKHGDSERLAQLRRRVTPFMLRRTKREVATELPDKVEAISTVTLSAKQADLYETIRLTTEKTVRDALASKGLAQSQIQVLDALLKLRQVCCDPRLVPLEAARKIKQSAKLDLLMELLPEMLAEGRRVLLFSQFTSMLALIEEALEARGLPWVKLTGQSKNRDALIDRFTSGEVPLFLISLKAGGVGLNLPQADTVIHYDPWWNPAVENQATDRAHRIGQKNRVFVYKLVAQGTIEERILALQERKAALAESMYSGAQARKQPLFTESDIAELLRPLGA